MKRIMGIVMIVAGVCLGLYFGLWVCFIGGIAGIINIVKLAIYGQDISGMAVAIDVAKIMLAGVVGHVSAAILAIPGLKMLTD